MSFFPSAYPEQSQASSPYAHSHPSTPRHDTPLSTRQEAARPNTMYHTGILYPEATDVTWPFEEFRGLGLSNLPVSQQGGLPTTTFDSLSSTSAPCAQPNHFQCASNSQDTTLVASSACWVCTFDDFAPGLPPTAWADMTQSSATVIERSRSLPEEIDYSTSSTFSCASSPYASSDGIMHAACSPAVKVEDYAEPSPSPFKYIPIAPFLDESKVVKPEQLVTTPSSSARQPSVARSLPSTPHFLDVKPVPSQSRPGSYRAYTTEDTRIYLREDRQKRGFTTPEDSTCACHLCGKMFKRSYNLKAHMVTHDPNRPQDYHCSHGDCTMRFARRTDLNRHVKCVHLNTRPFHCHLCDSSFSRMDTLRRHVIDGCRERPEVRRRPARMPRRAASASAVRRAPRRLPRETHLAPSPLRRRVAKL